MNDLVDVRLFDVQSFSDTNGMLVAYNGESDLGIAVRRVFIVAGHANSQRGKHAHKALTQVLVCVNGLCRVICDDGNYRKEFVLDRPSRALVVPNGIWAEQFYESQSTVLVVFCDLPYDEADYIRDYETYLSFRELGVL